MNGYNKRLQPVNMSASAPGRTVFSIGYDFHVGNGTTGSNNGNVWGITNYKDNSRNQSFTYDQLNRLTSAQNAGTNCAATTVNGKTEYWGNSYGYDAWGNLTGKTVTKCSAENLSLTALTNNRLSGYSYDAAGNMTVDPTDGVTLVYDAENRIATATKNGTTATYTYDANGSRVRKDVPGSPSTEYIYFGGNVIAEKNVSTGAFTNYVFFAGERVARRDSTGVFYYFSDHLKTASVITDSAGVIKSESDYYPWGGELQFTNNDSNHYKYGGHERDNESGLDYYGARYYSNPLGRFLTPDWAANPSPIPFGDQTDPQSLNQYSYVGNNPRSFIDPLGHDHHICDTAGKSCGDLKDDQYNQWLKDNPSVHQIGDKLYYSALGVDPHQIGTATYFNPADIEGAAMIGIGGTALVKEFAKQMVYNAVGGIAGRGVGAGIEAIQAARAARAISEGTHIALGARIGGLRSFAAKIGAGHLLDVAENGWQKAFLSHVANPSSKFSVSMEGFFGSTSKEMILNEMSSGSNTGWELKQLQNAGRLGDVDFYQAGQKIPNPF